ncbi:MAG TPA: response regulator [Dehalococcoidia bacterium]|nr:response regulator [Dehalococcoidia bacterium]
MANEPKILIADDELDFVVALQMTLEGSGYRVATACNRPQAQEMIRAERPDALILGTLMPRGEAFRLHQWLKQSSKFKDLPILVLDAPLEKRTLKGWLMDEIRLLEADDLVAKPVEPASLVERMEKLLARARHRIKVLVADDHTVVREGICAMLALQRDMEVVGQAIDGRDAVEKARLLSPDVVVMDIVMPKMNGLEATGQICKECPWIKVLVLTQYEEDENVLTSAREGARGFIPKRAAASELVAGIRSVFDGEYFMVPSATKALVERARGRSQN